MRQMSAIYPELTTSFILMVYDDLDIDDLCQHLLHFRHDAVAHWLEVNGGHTRCEKCEMTCAQ